MEYEYRCKLCLGKRYNPIIENIKDWEYGIDGIYSYRQCQDCDSIQLHPFPSIDDLIAAYDVDYHNYHERSELGRLTAFLYHVKESFLQRKLARLIKPGSKVLDIGCGAGEFLESLQSLQVLQAEGIDFEERAVKLGRAKGLTVHHGTFLEFEKTPGYYDAIFMNNYLEHTLNPIDELKKAKRMLKPGGHLIGEVPGFDSFERRLFSNYWGGNHVPRHTFQFGSHYLRGLLKLAGFAINRVTHDLNTGHWALSIQNFLQRNKPDLRHNPSVKHGRAAYYGPLLVTFVPINVLCVISRRAGVTKFYGIA